MSTREIHIISDPIPGHYDFMAEPTCVGHRSNILQPRAVRAAMALHLCDRQSNDWTGYRYVTENFHWDFNVEVQWCEVGSHVCNDPDEPVSVARQYCSSSDCGPVEEWTFDRYCSR